MRDGVDDDEEHDQPVQDEDMDQHRMQDFNEGDGRHGAIVEEAKRLMADDDDEPAKKEDEDTGPKIKMGRLGKKKKKGAIGDSSKSYTKQIGGASAAPAAPTNVGGGFSDGDIEFMKKAIQILCQSTNPLGKSIDFVTDDVDSMSKEYEHWRKESIACQQQLEEQQKITEEVV